MSTSWQLPPREIHPKIRVLRYAALTVGLIWGARRAYKLREPTLRADMDRRNKMFVKDDMQSYIRFLEYRETMNDLAEEVGVPYRLENSYAEMKKNGFVVNRAKYYEGAGAKDPYDGDVVKAYQALGIQYRDYYPGEKKDGVSL